MTKDKLNLSEDPTKVILDPKRKYKTPEIKEILRDRADAVYTAEGGKRKETKKKRGGK